MRSAALFAILGLFVGSPAGYLIGTRHVPTVESPALVATEDVPDVESPTIAPPTSNRSTAPISCYFSPSGGCTSAIIAELNAAKKSIDAQAYSFTSAPIAKAIADAYKRGVRVRVILDKGQQTAKYSSATFLRNASVPTWIDSKHAIAHNKIMMIDGQVLITGSFNFTAAAEKSNAENLLIIRDNDVLNAAYQENFSAHLAHSTVYTGPG